MHILIFKLSCGIYFCSVLILFYLVFNPNMDISPEIISYMEWWYSQPSSRIDEIVSTATLFAFVISLFGVIALFFLKKWGSYLFVPSVLLVICTEWLTPGYVPRSSFEGSIDTLTSVSIGFILCFILLSEKLDTFNNSSGQKNNQRRKGTDLFND